MKKIILTLLASAMATPALAASGPFFSLGNTDFVVLISFLVFLGVLVYFGVPKLLNGMLDARAETIRAELAEAKTLHEEAQALLVSYERKQAEVQAQADRIVASAREEAAAAAEQAKSDIKSSVARRLAAAEEKIASAEASAINEVREQAVNVAVTVAADLIAKDMTAAAANGLIDSAIEDVAAKLH